MLSTIELLLEELEELEELDELDAFRAAFGSVPVPPKKDWYHPSSTLELTLPTTRRPDFLHRRYRPGRTLRRARLTGG
jgi:hypothetical protein